MFREFACTILKKGSKITIFTVYAESVSEAQNCSQNNSSKFQGSPNMKNKNEQNNENVSKASKYKQNEELNTKESYIKKGK